MPTIGEVSKKLYEELKPFEITAQDIRLLIMHDEGFQDQIDVIINKDQEMKHFSMLEQQVERLKNNEPIEYVINETNFLMRKLYVDNNVLIPRSETEELVALISETIPDYFDPRNILVLADIGTGSGCIALALKDAFPSWVVIGSDIEEKALEVAKTNFATSHDGIEALHGDALEPFIKEDIKLDIIVSNPPYILNKEDAQASVRDFEPASALWMEKGKSVYEKIFDNYKKVKRGTLLMFFEISPDLEGWLVEIMKDKLEDYEYQFFKDMNGFTRFLMIELKYLPD